MIQTRKNDSTHPVQTNWSVVTGAPCSGKTTVINTLAAMGYPVIGETARNIIEEGIQKGAGIEEIIQDRALFEHRILTRNAAIAETLSPGRQTFLDRAVPDSIAYFQFHGIDATEPRALSRLYRYRHVFFFEAISYQNDPIRIEQRAEAEKIEALLIEAYEGLGYALIRVPVLKVADRVRFVLDRI
jgi:predicted ATPase